MKKIKKIGALCLAVLLCVSVCACGKTVQNMTYNSGDVKDGYTLVKAMQGVEFCVPSDMKEEAVTEDDLLENPDMEIDYENVTLEFETESEYLLLNAKEGFVLVAAVDVDGSLKDADDVDEALEIIEEDFTDSLEVGSGWAKTNIDGVTKIIFSATMSGEVLEFENVDEDTIYEGYASVIENKKGQAIGMYVFFVEGTEDGKDMAKYIAKSLEFNGKPVGGEDEDEDDHDHDHDYDDETDEDDYYNDGELDDYEDNDSDHEDDDSDHEEDLPSNNTDWKKGEFIVNGEKIKYPFTVEEFCQKTGATLTRADAEMVGPGSFSFAYFKMGKEEIVLHFQNEDYDNSASYKKATVCSVVARQDSSNKISSSIVFPGNIVVGRTKESDIEKQLGKATDIDEMEYITYYAYEYEVDDLEIVLEIQVDNATHMVEEVAYDYQVW